MPRASLYLTMSSSRMREIDCLRDLDEATLEDIAPMLRYKSVAKGELILATGDSLFDVYFVVEGRVRTLENLTKQRAVHFEDIGPGGMLGELSAIDQQPSSCDCIALSDCRLAILDQAEFCQILFTHPSVYSVVFSRLATMIRTNMRRVHEFSTLTVQKRVGQELLRIVGDSNDNAARDSIEPVPTHAEIAARVSASREVVTRELKSLEANGVITWKPGAYIIHRPEALNVQSL